MNGARLSGTLPSSISGLSALTLLDLGGNWIVDTDDDDGGGYFTISGTIPSTVGNLTALRYEAKAGVRDFSALVVGSVCV